MLNNPVYMIHETKDYDKLHVDPSNRPIRPSHVQYLKSRIEYKNLLAENPIIVDADMNVLDGQHRLQAAKELGLPIYYIVSMTMVQRDVPSLNDTPRGWKLEDHLHHYKERGLPDYVALHRFVESNPEIHLSDAMILCNRREDRVNFDEVERGKARLRQVFVDGNYVCNNLTFAERVAQVVRDFKRHFRKYYNQRVFVRAIANLVAHPQYEHKHMMGRMEQVSALLKPCVKTADYMDELNEIYNYGVRKSNRVEFTLNGNGKH
jgi:hypothetical protein